MAAEKKAGGRSDNATSGPSSFWPPANRYIDMTGNESDTCTSGWRTLWAQKIRRQAHLLRTLFTPKAHRGITVSTGFNLWGMFIPLRTDVVACDCGHIFWRRVEKGRAA